MKNGFFLITFLFLAACASIHEGNKAKTVKGETIEGLTVSAVDSSPSLNDPFALFTLTFENSKMDWLRIDSAEVELDENEAKVLSVVVGQDLRDWGTASRERLEKEKRNNRLTQIGLIALGTLASLSGNHDGNSTLESAGIMTAAAGWGWALHDSIKNSSTSGIGLSRFPEHHLYSPFAIPGTMYLRKWVLLNRPSRYKIHSLALKIHTVDGHESHLVIPIN